MKPPRVRGFVWNNRPDACPALLEVHHVVWGHRFRPEGRHSLAHWALIGLLTPGFRVRAGSEQAPWLPHAPFTWRLYPPGCAFWEDDREATEPTRSMWIAFTGGERIGLDRYIARRAGYASFEDKAGALVTHVDRMVTLAERHREGGYWILQMELVRMLVLLEGATRLESGHYRLAGDEPRRQTADPRVARAEQYIRTHVMDVITLGSVARYAKTSVPTLARLYKLATGESPMQTWSRLRIERTRDLLLDGRSLKEIADLLGYYDAFHLSKIFKQFEGCSPRDWLKTVRALPPSHDLHLRRDVLPS